MSTALPDLDADDIVRWDLPHHGSVAISVWRPVFDPCEERIEFDVGSYTNKRLVCVEGEALFGELAILKLVRQSGWDGAWLDTYHQHKRWQAMPHLATPIELPVEIEELLSRIRKRAGSEGGAFDVIAWMANSVAFLESKGPGDSLRSTQLNWIDAALTEGMPVDAFTLVEWTVAGEPGRGRGSSRARAPDSRAKPGGLPTKHQFATALPGAYREKLRRMEFTPAMDNTLRRVQRGLRTYPTRVGPIQARGLVTDSGTGLTEAGKGQIEYLDRFLEGGYPEELLQ